MSLHLLVTSPRVPAGLLSRAAWQRLDEADVVLCRAGGADSPTVLALRQAGVAVVAVDGTARETAARLLQAAATRTAVWVGSEDADPGLADALAAELTRQAPGQGRPDGEEDGLEVELLVGSWDAPGMRLLDAVAVMDRLRGPSGCPWDAEQTHASLTKYLLEEAHEAVEALESGDDEHAAEELGDVLLQVLFHARVAQERRAYPAPGAQPEGPQRPVGYDIDDIAGGLVEKLVRRHPHVFAGPGSEDPHAAVSEAGQVEAAWEQIKAAEKAARTVGRDGAGAAAVERGPLADIPTSLPTLARAGKVASRMARAGLLEDADALVPDQSGVAPAPVGERLWALVVEAQAAGVDADQSLREVLRKLQAEHG